MQPGRSCEGKMARSPQPSKSVNRTTSCALRLFIDLYHAHDLINGPGINWRAPHGLRFKYERVQLGQRGEYFVWGFKPLNDRSLFSGAVL